MNLTFRLRPGDGQGPDAYLGRQPSFRTMPRFMVHETGVHFVDVFRVVLGRPIAVTADLRRLNPAIAGEDAGHVLFDHGNGVRSLLDANRLADHAAPDRRRAMGEALVEGTEGTLTLTGDGAVGLRPFGADATDPLLPAIDRPGFGGDCVRALQAHVVAHLIDGTALENAAADYLAVMETEAAIYRAAGEGRRIALA